MSGISRRTVLLEIDNRFPGDGAYHRPSDWAMVDTGIGSMAEPFCAFNRHSVNTPGIEMDWTDQMVRVDKIEVIDLDKESILLSGGNQMHGGYLMPRDGR